MIKIIIVGTKGYAGELLKYLLAMPELCEVAGVAELPGVESPMRAECARRGIPVYPHIDRLLEETRGQADAAVLATPIQTHYDFCLQCMEAGLDVLLDKPPVATVQELDALAGHAARLGRRVAVGFQHLYTPQTQELQRRIVSGALGRVRRIRVMGAWIRPDSYYERAGWAGQVRLNGKWVLDGTLNNPMAHFLAWALFMASPESGKMAASAAVEAELYHAHNIPSEDTSCLRVMTADGVEVLFYGTLCPEEEIGARFSIEADLATVESRDFQPPVILWRDGAREQLAGITDELETRRHMLRTNIGALDSGRALLVPLESTRPFTVAVNAAFESCGAASLERARAIPADFIVRQPREDSVQTIIPGINFILNQAFETGLLFSELDVPWAVKSGEINTTAYDQFPSAERGTPREESPAELRA